MPKVIDIDREFVEENAPHSMFAGGSEWISPYSIPESIEIDQHPGWAALRFRYPSTEGGEAKVGLKPSAGGDEPEAVVHVATLGSYSKKILAIELKGPPPAEKEISELADDLEHEAEARGIPTAQRFSYQMVAAVLRHCRGEIVKALKDK